MKRGRYINDPHWRMVWEMAEEAPWWSGVLSILFLLLVMLPAVLVMRLFGWRPSDD